MTEPSHLKSHIGYWLRFVSNHVSHSFARKVEAEGVTVAEWVILRELYERGPTAPSTLADHLGLTRGAVSKLADRLEAKALIVRRHDEADRRYQLLEMRPAARELIPELARLADANDAHFFAPLSSGERAELIRLMQIVIRHHGLKSTPIE